MLSLDRRRELLHLISTRGSGQVGDLARALGVSASTVRRDLNELHDRGLLARVHGGAARADVLEPLRATRVSARPEQKRRIGARAARLVYDGSTILVTGGTTTEAMLPFLEGVRGLTVLTNGLAVASALARFPHVEVVVLGGLLRASEMSLLGHLTVAALRELTAEQVFTGAWGVDELGITGADLAEATTDRSVVAAARRLVVLADAAKIGRRGTVRLAGPDAVDVLVTDTDADPDRVAAIRAQGIEVLLA